MSHKPDKLNKAKSKFGFDHSWPRKRSLNIESMIERMKKDRAYLFEMAHTFLNDHADIFWTAGDNNLSILIAWIAASMHSEKMKIKHKTANKRVPRKR